MVLVLQKGEEDELFLRHMHKASTFQEVAHRKMKRCFEYMWVFTATGCKMSVINTLKDCIFRRISQCSCVHGGGGEGGCYMSFFIVLTLFLFLLSSLTIHGTNY